MKRKVTIATDSFKGSLTARRASKALAEGVCSVVPDCEVEVIPLADGGEGTAEILTEALQGVWVELSASDPIGRPIVVRYGLCGEVAVMDMSAAAGLTLLSQKESMRASTFGVGEMILDALRRGARRVVVGAGGSATTDCGMGALEALGYGFLDANGRKLQGCGETLARVVNIDKGGVSPLLEGVRIEIIADVGSPLYGPMGAAQVFAPQKGANPEQVALLDDGLKHFAKVVEECTQRDMASVVGAGAAGGFAGGLWAFVGAEIRCGVDVVLEAVEFDRRAAGSDLIITGEGRVDSQTLMGKVPGGVLERGRSMGAAVVAVGGSVEWSRELLGCGFSDIVAATPEGMPLQEAMQSSVAEENLRQAGALVAESFLR